MVSRYAGGIRGSKIRQFRILGIGMNLLRTSESRLEQSLIANAKRTPMLGELSLVNGEHNRQRDPARLLHFASSRRASL